MALLLAVLSLAPAVAVGRAGAWAWLGVRIRDLSEAEMEEIASRHGIREGFGVVIVDVVEGAPAARAGLKSGDIVVALDGKPVTDTRTLQRMIAGAPVDADTRLTLLGTRGRRVVSVRLAPMPADVVGERMAAEFGFVLRDAEAQPELGGQTPGSSAPAVSVVVRGSAAQRAGLEVGDVILQVGERSVITREAARAALAEASLDRPLRITVRRGADLVSLTLSVP
jgi:S1-C subfamily serine protease